MAQGVPALASPVPSYKEVIGKTGGGRICTTDKEWEKALDDITENRGILKKWSRAGYSGMKEYSTEFIVNKYIQLFNKLL